MNTLRVVKRVPFTKDVVINDEIMVKAIDISEGGMYVHTGRSNIPGQIVEVALPFNGENFKVKAKVAHNQKAVGMGLMFVNLSHENRRKISGLISSLEGGSSLAAVTGCRSREGKCRVLLVDDDPSVQRIYKSRLVFEGFSVVTANDGFEALSIINTPKSELNLVILDLHLHKIDGFKVLAALRETPHMKKIPVIILSAQDSAETIRRVMEKGAVRFFPKARTSPAELAGAVTELLRSRPKAETKMNCWEFLKCGRIPGGENTGKMGVCPVAVMDRLDGVHGGRNAGRACWAVVGTLCKGAVHGTVLQKYGDCVGCGFHEMVRKEEGADYRDTIQILHRLEG